MALLRPKQWSKNLLVFAALLFSAGFLRTQPILLSLAAFAAMCLASSATYVFNDLADIERDRRHPTKKNRPLASGKVSVQVGVAVGIAALAGSLAIAAFLGRGSVAILLTYLVMQALYNWRFKHLPVADVYCIAFGFVLRAALGAEAIKATLSPWLLLCTGTLALMLGFAKRRQEFVSQGESRHETRESLVHYSRFALDSLVLMFAAMAAVFYGIYCIDSQTAHKYPGIFLTAPCVFYGITRYVLIVFADNEGAEPADILFRDKHIIASVLLFILLAVCAMEGMHLPVIER